jgi:hypothetical protein
MFRFWLLLTGCLIVIVCGTVDAAQPSAPSGIGPVPGMPILPQSPPFQARQRDVKQPAAPDETVVAATQDLAAKLNSLLTLINEGREPNATDLAPIADSLKKNKLQLQKMDAKGQANLEILNAWMNFFGGQLKRAKLAAGTAYRTDTQNRDAETTFIVMSIVNNDIRGAKSTITMMRRKTAKPAGGESPAVLDFDVNSVKTELLGDKLGAFDAACLNGSTFSFRGGKTLLMLLWSTAGAPAEVSSSGGTAPEQQGQTPSPLAAYASLFAQEFQNGKVAFLGLNLDAPGDSGAVMAALMKNAWPWPQAMAQDPRNETLVRFASLRSGKPLFMMVGPDGEIKYAGALTAFVLKTMASYTSVGSEMTPALPEPVKTTEEVNVPQTPAEEIKEANVPAVAAPPQPPLPKPKAQKSEEETFNPQAVDLYQFAVAQKRMAHIIGYGKMIEACRQILREYPDTPEAEKARQLLREVPESKRQQFHITNEEMGL